MAKKVFYDDDARARVLGGAEALYNAVKVTYGPKGRNVVIAKGFGGPTVTHDGVTVAERRRDARLQGWCGSDQAGGQELEQAGRRRHHHRDSADLFDLEGG